jgi:hypothetical protein
MGWKGDSPVMSERTVSVELTEAQIREIRRGVPFYLECFDDVFAKRLTTALAQFDADRDREAKVQVMVEIVLPPASGIFASKRLDDLNAAGWDLVRMEDK